jgi:hypothetical protein
MADRTDIDALLIGALYGELTPADEARLSAHLESHPADRTALSDLARTREAVRDSRILAVQLEPPQSVSARLLQEAARRTPRHAPESASWFQRFLRSFASHPAMAAAAMFAVVIGVAGLVYVRRGGEHFVESISPPSATGPSAAASTSPGAPPPAAAPAVEPPPPGASVPEPAADDRAGAASGSYRVRLAEEAKQVARADLKPSDSGAKDVAVLHVDPERAMSKVGRAEDAPARPRRPAGIELRTPEPQLKELPEREVAKKAKLERDVGRSGARDQASAPADERMAQATAGAPSGSGAAAPPAAMPQSPPIVANELNGNAVNGPSYRFGDDKGNTANQRAAAGKASAPAAAKPADDKAGDDRTLLGWARKRHSQVVALVHANDCLAAATAAIEIFNLVPGYYTANVVNDREVRPCLPYVTRERDREMRSRAAKRANAVEAPAQAAPPPPVRK